MTELPESVDLQWIGRTLIALQRDVRDMREDQRVMREQVDVVVMTSLRLERGLISLRDDVRDLRDRINRLEDAR
jgi:hypothetical protein